MSKYTFGIDLGTSTSEICYLQNGRPVAISDPHKKTPIVPSVVAVNRKDQLVVGFEALENVKPESVIREAKRNMGTDTTYEIEGHQLRPHEVAALVLRKMAQNAQISLGVSEIEAVVTVPAYFDDLPRRATEQAAHTSGIKLLRLISEPVAAAMAYGLDKLNEEGLILVFDFGGGTLDVTVIEMYPGVLEVKATDGDKALGGKDIDQCLMELVADKLRISIPEEKTQGYHDLKKAVEAAKKELSASYTANIYIPRMEHNGELKDWDVDVSREEFEKAIQPILSKAEERVHSVLKKAGISSDEIDRLLLVGGSCYTPAVRKMVEAAVKVTAEVGLDPDMAVAYGAAISAGLKTGVLSAENSIVVQDASTFRLGISCLSEVGDQIKRVFSELMPANASIPFFRREQYHLLRLDQDTVQFEVLQDPSLRAILADDAIPTGAIGVISDIPPSTTPEPRSVDIEIRQDESHIIRVHGKIVGIDRSATIQLNSNAALGNPVEQSAGKASIEALWERSPLAARNAALIKRAESVLETHPSRFELIEAALQSLKVAVASDDGPQCQLCRERLVEVLSEE